METNGATGPEGSLKGDSTGLEKKQKQQSQEIKKVRAMVAMDDSRESFYALRWALDNLFSHTGSSSTTMSTPHPPPHDAPPGVVEEFNLVTLVHVMEPLPHYVYPGGYGMYICVCVRLQVHISLSPVTTMTGNI